jgi:sRNA-binding carbon storage regulator CsrA
MQSLQEEVGRLVLSRKVGESIDFDGIIKITLCIVQRKHREAAY